MESNIFRKIMIATDGSEEVKKAVNTAIKITELATAKLYAVHVISMGFYSMTLPTDEDWNKAFQERIETEGKEATAYVENAGKTANVEVESAILRGSPAEELIGFAERNDIDLVVMGTLGRTGIKGFLKEVWLKIVRHSKKPVLVVRGETFEEIDI